MSQSVSSEKRYSSHHKTSSIIRGIREAAEDLTAFIGFMVDVVRYPEETFTIGLFGYVIQIHDRGTPTVRLLRQSGNRFVLGSMLTLAFWSPPEDITDTWTHYDVTRNSTGGFTVKVNETPAIEYVDTTYGEAGAFAFYVVKNLYQTEATGPVGNMLDNVVVTDEVPVTTTTTTTTIPLPDDIPLELLALGIGVPVVIIAIIIGLRMRRS